jgi:hypothetical protein
MMLQLIRPRAGIIAQVRAIEAAAAGHPFVACFGVTSLLQPCQRSVRLTILTEDSQLQENLITARLILQTLSHRSSFPDPAPRVSVDSQTGRRRKFAGGATGPAGRRADPAAYHGERRDEKAHDCGEFNEALLIVSNVDVEKITPVLWGCSAPIG